MRAPACARLDEVCVPGGGIPLPPAEIGAYNGSASACVASGRFFVKEDP